MWIWIVRCNANPNPESASASALQRMRIRIERKKSAGKEEKKITKITKIIGFFFWMKFHCNNLEKIIHDIKEGPARKNKRNLRELTLL